ncbi:MAG: F420-dependent oxidoreductase-like protein [Gammaproteobacteria bacterium]|jgi:F420-dependent oxidoreductase-like protein
MRYAIKTSPQYTTFDDMLQVWTAADQMEIFESAWNFDHFYPIMVEDTTGPCMEAWVTLAALAQATKRIRVGCLVSGVLYRHPAVLANMISTLDIVSKGRLEIGLGAGWNEEECDAYGIELGTMTQRFDRFDECCEIIMSLLTQETTNFEGKFFTLKNARNNPAGIQKPHPPICIGGSGPKRTLPNVARYAQHWNYPHSDVEGFLESRQILHAICKETGRDPAEIITSTHIRVNHKDMAETEANCKQFKDAGLDLAICAIPPPHKPDILKPLAAIAERVG